MVSLRGPPFPFYPSPQHHSSGDRVGRHRLSGDDLPFFRLPRGSHPTSQSSPKQKRETVTVSLFALLSGLAAARFYGCRWFYFRRRARTASSGLV